MKFLYSIVKLSILSLLCIVWSCKHESNELAHEHNHGHDHEHEHEHQHDKHDGDDDEIILSPALASKMGVETMTIEKSDFETSLLVSGRIEGAPSGQGMAVATTSGVLNIKNDITVGVKVKKGQVIATVNTSAANGGDVNAIAKATMEAARKELERLTPLYEKKLITAEKYNAAKSAYEIARKSYSPSAASGVISAPVSGVITQINAAQGQYVDAGTQIATISDGTKLTLIAELPSRYSSQASEWDGAQIKMPGSDTVVNLADLDGHRTASTAYSNTPGYVPLFFTFNNNGEFYTGAVVEVYLLGKSKENVISVPRSAVTEQQGAYFVYQKVDDEGYIKIPVRKGESNGQYIEIVEGLEPGEEIVYKGVTALRLAETSGAVPEGHTHSH